VLEVRVLVGSWLEAVGTDGRVGSVLGDCEGLPGWFGFHICLVLPFVYCWIQAPEQPCGAVSAFQGKSGGTVSFLLIACPANANASGAILALLCILTTVTAKLKSPIPKLSDFRWGRPISINKDMAFGAICVNLPKYTRND
jgi:hypothetical protein